MNNAADLGLLGLNNMTEGDIEHIAENADNLIEIIKGIKEKVKTEKCEIAEVRSEPVENKENTK